MKKIISQIFIFSIFTMLVIAGDFFIKKPDTIGASNSKVITVTFATTPTTATVTKTPLKYNKDFAFSFQTDDGSQDNYETGFKYMYGGTSLLDLDGTTGADVFGGLYFTDGSGRSQALSSRPFLGDFVWNSRNYSSNFAVLHPNEITQNTFSGTNLLDAYTAGFNVINHSWSHAAASDTPSGRTYAYPAPHGTSVIDYDYEITQNEAELATFGVPASLTLVPPSGDHGYINPAFTRGYKFIASESVSFSYSSNPVITVNPATDGMNVTNNVDLEHLFSYRKFYNDDRFIPYTSVNINTYLDDIAAKSRSTNKYWAIGFTHRTGGSSGGLNFANYKLLMDHLATTYGRAGDDSIWMAPAQEVYEYMGVKQNTGVSTSTVGNVMTITLDTSAVPSGYRRYALSLKVSSNAQIQSISYAGGEFTTSSENLTTGLINVDWGTVFTANDFTRVETLVATAESTRLQSSIDTATTYVNFLPASPEKNAFTTRLGNITVVGKRFLINLGLSSTGKVLDSVVGSPTNGLCWNNARVGKSSNSDFPEKVSDALYDANSDCASSNATNLSTVTVVQPLSTANNTMTVASSGTTYSNGQQGAQAATDGTGLYPNDKLQTGIVSYNATQTPATLEIRHLDITKSYRVKLLGNTKNIGTTRTQGTFGVTGAIGTTTTGTLLFLNNIGTNVALNTTISPTGTACSTGCATATFNSVMPVNSGGANGGVITITVTPSNTNNSIIPLNVIDISEVTPAKPVVNFTGSALRSQGTGLVDFDYNILDDNSSVVDFLTYEYSNTGAFGGEQSTATPKSSDGAHSGISNLTSSPTGIAHRFVWDALINLSGQEGTFYLRLLPHSPTQTGNYYQSTGVFLDFKNPVQSSISAATTSTTSQITWTTQENAFGLLEYGLTSSYTNNAGSLSTGVAVMSHDFTASGLSSCTVYHYRVSSRDSVGNTTVSSDQTFQTAGCPDPVSSVTPGIYNSTQSITLSASGSSSIRYSTSSLPADCSSGTLYSSAISVSTTQTIYVRACDISNNSTTASFAYTIDTTLPSTPVASPIAGLYNSTQSVTLSASGSDLIRYSMSGTPASCASDTLYSTAISISSTSTIYTRACDTAGNSSTESFVYTIDSSSGSSGSSGGSSGSSTIVYVNRFVPVYYSNPASIPVGGLMMPAVTASTPASIPSVSVIPAVKNTSAVFSTSVVLSFTPKEILSQTKNIDGILKVGDTGSDIKILQKFLIDQKKGPKAKELSRHVLTNNFGQLTKQALMEWQKKNKIPATGTFGPQTRAKIQKLVK